MANIIGKTRKTKYTKKTKAGVYDVCHFETDDNQVLLDEAVGNIAKGTTLHDALTKIKNREIADKSITSAMMGDLVAEVYRDILPTGSDLNLITDYSRYMLLRSSTYSNAPTEISYVYSFAILQTYACDGGNVIQYYTDAYNAKKYVRVLQGGTWSDWKFDGSCDYALNASTANIDDLSEYAVYEILSTTTGTLPEPITSYGILEVKVFSDEVMQVLNIYEGSTYRRFRHGGVWSDWSKVYDGRFPKAYHYPYIYNGRVCCNKDTDSTTAYYAGLDFGSGVKINVLSAHFVWSKAKSGQKSGTVAIITNPNGVDKISDITDLSLHCVQTATYVKVDILGNKFGKYYYQNLIDAQLSVAQELDGVTEHILTLAVTSPTTIDVYIDEKYAFHGTFTPDSNIASLNDVIGQYATFEHYCYGNMDDFAMPMFTYWTCRQDSVTYVNDQFDREDGRLTNTPQGIPYHLISATHNAG